MRSLDIPRPTAYSVFDGMSDGMERGTQIMGKPASKATRTNIPGVYFIMGTSRATGKPERIFYISYYRNGKRHFEKAGRQVQDNMTPRIASGIRSDRMRGKELPNRERRASEKAAKETEAGRWTIDKLWTEYVKQRYHGKADLTDAANYRNHLKTVFGGMEPSELVPLDIDRLRVRLLKMRSPATVAKVLGLLRRIILFGEKKYIAKGPGFRIQLPKVNNEKTEFLTDAQVSAYIKVCREWADPQAGNFQLLELLTGMRRSEARSLRWENVDLDRGFLTLRGRKGGQDLTVPLSAAAKELLESHPHEDKNPYVFSGERGKGPRGIKQIAKTAREIRAAAGLPSDFRPNHGLRHAFASALASSGETDLYTIQKLLGHRTPLMTARYSHLHDEALRRGVDIMGRLAGKKEDTAGGGA